MRKRSLSWDTILYFSLTSFSCLVLCNHCHMDLSQTETPYFSRKTLLGSFLVSLTVILSSFYYCGAFGSRSVFLFKERQFQIVSRNQSQLLLWVLSVVLWVRWARHSLDCLFSGSRAYLLSKTMSFTLILSFAQAFYCWR